jgi:hypothetical protein
MFGTFFEKPFSINENYNNNFSQRAQYLGSGRWLDEYQTGIFHSEQLKAPHSSCRVSLRGSIYVR